MDLQAIDTMQSSVHAAMRKSKSSDLPIDTIAPPSIDSIEAGSSLGSSRSNSSNLGDLFTSGSFSFSSLSSDGQLTPPFTSSSSSSSSANIADIDIDQQHAQASATIMMEERAVKEDNNKVDIKQRKAVPRAELRRYAAEIVRKEAQALLDLAARLDPIDDPVSEKYGPRLLPGHEQDDFSRAVDLLKHMNSHGRIIMTGVGKSGLLARKAVATFNSFGIPSAFLHPLEALHGDLGSLSPYGLDTVILISYSGRTAELLELLQHLRRRRTYACISLSTPDSALAEACDVNIDVSLHNDEEAEECVPAPTSSVVTALAALDALALTLLRLKTGWNAHNSERRKAFGLHHPGGSLGQQLSSVAS